MEGNIINNIYYNKINFYEGKNTKTLTLISKFKTIKQEEDNTCACACVRMLFSYYGLEVPSELQLKLDLKTQPFPVGTNLLSITNFLLSKGVNYQSSYETKNGEGISFDNYDKFKKFIKNELLDGNPILVENVDYGGHWRIIIGIDEICNQNQYADILIFADPDSYDDFDNNGYAYSSAYRFYNMWFDDHCLLECEKKQPYLVVRGINEKNK